MYCIYCYKELDEYRKKYFECLKCKINRWYDGTI